MTTIPVITLETINRNILNHEVRAAFEQTRSLHGSSLPFGAMARSFPFSHIAFGQLSYLGRTGYSHPTSRRPASPLSGASAAASLASSSGPISQTGARTVPPSKPICRQAALTAGL